MAGIATLSPLPVGNKSKPQAVQKTVAFFMSSLLSFGTLLGWDIRDTTKKLNERIEASVRRDSIAEAYAKLMDSGLCPPSVTGFLKYRQRDRTGFFLISRIVEVRVRRLELAPFATLDGGKDYVASYQADATLPMSDAPPILTIKDIGLSGCPSGAAASMRLASLQRRGAQSKPGEGPGS